MWAHEENPKTNGGQICTASLRSLPSLPYFQHLCGTMASAAQIVLICFEWFDLWPHPYLWVIGTEPSMASLFCVLPYWCPQTGKGHPANRPFFHGNKAKSLQICFSVVYISVSRLLYTCTGWLMKESACVLPLHRKQRFNLLHIWFKSKEISSRASDRSAFFVWWCNHDPHGSTLVHMHKYINFKQTELMKSAHYPSFTLLYENKCKCWDSSGPQKRKGQKHRLPATHRVAPLS